MRNRLLLAAAITLTLAACGEPSASPPLAPTGATKDESTCRSGYHIATREDGSEYCAPDAEPL